MTNTASKIDPSLPTDVGPAPGAKSAAVKSRDSSCDIYNQAFGERQYAR